MALLPNPDKLEFLKVLDYFQYPLRGIKNKKITAKVLKKDRCTKRDKDTGRFKVPVNVYEDTRG